MPHGSAEILPETSRQADQVPDHPRALVDGLLRYHQEGFSELIVMLSGGSMPTAKDPVQTAGMVAEQVLPKLRSGA